MQGPGTQPRVHLLFPFFGIIITICFYMNTLLIVTACVYTSAVDGLLLIKWPSTGWAMNICNCKWTCDSWWWVTISVMQYWLEWTVATATDLYKNINNCIIFFSQIDNSMSNFISSKVTKFTWKRRNVLKRMKNQLSDFCDF